MKSLSLKLDDELFLKLENIRENLHEARNRFINEAIKYYIEKRENEYIKEQLHMESMLIREESEKFVKEFENYDGLEGENEWEW